MNIQELKAKYPKRYDKEYWKWKEYATDYDWWDDAYEWLKEDAKPKGLYIDDIYFSGFWSQGDGARWEGDIDVVQLLKAKGLDTEPVWFTMIALIRDGRIDDRAKIDGGGYGNTRSFLSIVRDYSVFCINDDSVVCGGVLAGANVLDLYEAIGGDAAIDELVGLIDGAAEDYATYIYRSLEDEYEHLTSKEAFEDSCVCNEIDFDDEGEE